METRRGDGGKQGGFSPNPKPQPRTTAPEQRPLSKSEVYARFAS